MLERSERLKDCEVSDGHDSSHRQTDSVEEEDTKTKETERKGGTVRMQVDRKINFLILVGRQVSRNDTIKGILEV